MYMAARERLSMSIGGREVEVRKKPEERLLREKEGKKKSSGLLG